MSFYDIPSDFVSKLTGKYESAVANEHIVFAGDSAISEIVERKVKDKTYEFQLTHLETLKKRPAKGSKEENPFAKPEPELTILDSYGPNDEFRVVFNKFPVVPNHFMIITKEFVSQNTPLSPIEINASYSILTHLKKHDRSGKNWFAFYNCGQQSGASQPHKHIQFMTLPNGYTPPIDSIANSSPAFIPSAKQEPLQDSSLPFAHYVARLPDDISDLNEDDLTMYFSSLLQRALTTLKQNGHNHISYNFCLTTKYMMVVPRASGYYKDLLGVNSCGVMGLFLCKNQELVDLVKHDGPENVLASVGLPNTSGEPTDEYHY